MHYRFWGLLDSCLAAAVIIFFFPLTAFTAGGYEQARIYSQSPQSLHIEGYVNKNNVVTDFNIINNKIKGRKPNHCFLNAPQQQPNRVKFGHVNFPTTPDGYNQVIAWLNITNDGNNPGSVEVKSMELWGKDANDQVFLVSDDLFCKKDYCNISNLVWGSMLQNKDDWDDTEKWREQCENGSIDVKNCEGGVVNPLIFQINWNKPNNGLFSIPTVIFPTGDYYDQVFHPWLAVWDDEEPNSPRSDALPDVQYAVRVIAKINGAGRIQAGLDYWAPPGMTPYCAPWNKKSNNCEGAVSNWQCTSNGWVSIIAGAAGIFQP